MAKITGKMKSRKEIAAMLDDLESGFGKRIEHHEGSDVLYGLLMALEWALGKRERFPYGKRSGETSRCR